jgi:hypothetical protein
MGQAKKTQKCYLCGIEKPLIAFILRVDDQYYNMCRDCVSDILLQARTRKREALTHTVTHRTCYLCRRLLPLDQFTRRSTGSYFSACKDCNTHVFAQKRRARMKGAVGSYTAEEWRELIRRYDHCPMCKRSWDAIPFPLSGSSVITVDHIIPISKGGSNSIDNLQPLCYSCNSKKGAKTT